MKRRSLVWFLILCLLSLPACVRSVSTTGGAPEIVQATPTLSQAPPAATVPAVTATPLAARVQTTPALTASLTALPSFTPPASSEPSTPTSAGLSPEVSQSLALMPLVAGSSWVYSDEAYSGDEKAVWRVVDTVTDNAEQGGIFAARVQREVTLLSGSPSANFVNPPANQVFWYLVSGHQVFRQDVDQAAGLAWSHLDGLTLELVLPLSSGAACWYPDPAQRKSSSAGGLPGCRSGGDAASRKYPAGSLDGCHQVTTPYNDGAEQWTFCDGVGIAERVFNHTGSPFGEHFVLTGYLAQTP